MAEARDARGFTAADRAAAAAWEKSKGKPAKPLSDAERRAVAGRISAPAAKPKPEPKTLREKIKMTLDGMKTGGQ